jgi:AraC family transcriptional regulator of adaptative response/methylated-DNA-[protein]-cysteine methyltransferase
MKTLPPRDEMERAYLAGDAGYEGVFLVAVRTTSIFCRPTCRARKPLPRNVEFYATAREALSAGYRPCKRCRPMALDDQPEWAARLIADVEAAPTERVTDADLKSRGIDPATVRRYFLRRYGMTFQAYARARRMAGALGSIRSGGTVDDAVFGGGYESHSGFREAFGRLVGVPPGAARDGAGGVLLRRLSGPLGPMVAGATEQGVCLLEFGEPARLEAQLAAVRRRFDGPTLPGSNGHLDTLERELGAYFAGTLRSFTVPVVVAGTTFQERVWSALRAIPYGETRSYEQVAEAVSSPRAVRAVGMANGRNRVAIVIPCHRVVNKSGDLGGYGGGLWRKRFLLELEREAAGNGAPGVAR